MCLSLRLKHTLFPLNVTFLDQQKAEGAPGTSKTIEDAWCSLPRSSGALSHQVRGLLPSNFHNGEAMQQHRRGEEHTEFQLLESSQPRQQISA